MGTGAAGVITGIGAGDTSGACIGDTIGAATGVTKGACTGDTMGATTGATMLCSPEVIMVEKLAAREAGSGAGMPAITAGSRTGWGGEEAISW